MKIIFSDEKNIKIPAINWYSKVCLMNWLYVAVNIREVMWVTSVGLTDILLWSKSIVWVLLNWFVNLKMQRKKLHIVFSKTNF